MNTPADQQGLWGDTAWQRPAEFDPSTVKCPYCGATAQLVDSSAVYKGRTDLWGKAIYVCTPCDARVGCHAGTAVPLGRLANAELRQAKVDAHAAFDPLWRTGGYTRGTAYRWLQKAMGRTRAECHIGLFDVDDCRKVTELCKAKRTKM